MSKAQKVILTKNEDGSISIPSPRVLIDSFAQILGNPYANKLNELNISKRYLEAGAGINTISNNFAQIGFFNKNDLGGGVRSGNYFNRSIDISGVDTNFLTPSGKDASDGKLQMTLTNQSIL
jgi:hypothetical protein